MGLNCALRLSLQGWQARKCETETAIFKGCPKQPATVGVAAPLSGEPSSCAAAQQSAALFETETPNTGFVFPAPMTRGKGRDV